MSGGQHEWKAAVEKQPSYTPLSNKLVVALVQGAGRVERFRAN